jgi:hypothetical protein
MALGYFAATWAGAAAETAATVLTRLRRLNSRITLAT